MSFEILNFKHFAHTEEGIVNRITRNYEISANTIGKKEGPSTTTKLIPQEKRGRSSINLLS